MNTIALEFVPPNREDGHSRAVEDAHKIIELSKSCGLPAPIQHVMIPGMIEEDSDRPVPMKPKFEPIETWNAIRKELPGMKGLCTQVTAFSDEPTLRQRFDGMLQSGMDGVIFVGVPRTMSDGEGNGIAPTDALGVFADQLDNRGVILIPTREAEEGRFNFKCDCGATFALTQLLYSDAIVAFLNDFAKRHEHRPEVLLSFGFVPKAEQRVGLINWLIQDPGNPLVKAEQAYVRELTEMSLERKKASLLDLYRRVTDGVRALGFPVSIHLEAPYGFTKPAFECFAELLDYWAPSGHTAQ